LNPFSVLYFRFENVDFKIIFLARNLQIQFRKKEKNLARKFKFNLEKKIIFGAKIQIQFRKK
jgi:hypothetical protein